MTVARNQDSVLFVRLSPQGRDCLLKLTDHLGITQKSLVEMLLREAARTHGLLGRANEMTTQDRVPLTATVRFDEEEEAEVQQGREWTAKHHRI